MAKTILVVDDSETVRQQVSMALKHAGFVIAEAADGQEGLAMIEANRIDMVVCDVHMPGMNGLEMVEAVKSRPEHKSLPILMLTTSGQPSMIKRPVLELPRGKLLVGFKPDDYAAALG